MEPRRTWYSARLAGPEKSPQRAWPGRFARRGVFTVPGLPFPQLGVSWNGGTPSHHPNFSGIFHETNQPAIGVAHFRKLPTGDSWTPKWTTRGGFLQWRYAWILQPNRSKPRTKLEVSYNSYTPQWTNRRFIMENTINMIQKEYPSLRKPPNSGLGDECPLNIGYMFQSNRCLTGA